VDRTASTPYGIEDAPETCAGVAARVHPRRPWDDPEVSDAVH
jgi:hypothetical protein